MTRGILGALPLHDAVCGGRSGAVALMLLAISGLAGPVAAQPAAVDLQVGRAAYNRVCAECHGPAGRGDGPTARKLGFRPRDFSLGVFKCRCTPTGQPPTDEDLLRTVTFGMPGTPMQPHDKDLTELERQAVIQFVKTLSPKFGAGNAPSCGPAPSPLSPSAELVAEGRQVYRLMQCAKCHGKTGQGDGPSAPTLKDDWGQPIKPHNFVATGWFKCGTDARDLYRTLTTGMAGSPMPSFAAALQFSRDDFPRDNLQGLGARAEVEEMIEYLERQANAAAVRAMSETARRELADRRTWALVQYLRSLLAARRSGP